MQELDEWTEATVISPLHEAITEGNYADCDAAFQAVKKAIREKVLESYRNGQAAGPRPATPARKEWRNAQVKTR